MSPSAFLSVLGLFAQPVEPSTIVTPHATVRLVIEAPDGSGSFRGALLVDLAPGWKTYWIDPGPSGIAPVLDLSLSQDVGSIVVDHPAPGRFGDGLAAAVGYETSTGFALSGEVSSTAYRPEVRATFTFGVCREVCVPERVFLTASVPAKADIETGAIVDGVFSALPGLVDEGFSASIRGDLVEISGPDWLEDVFLYADGWSFGVPARVGDVFVMPVVERGAGRALEVVGTGAGRSVIQRTGLADRQEWSN